MFIRAYGGKKDGKHLGLGMVLRRLRQELEIWFIHSFIQPLLSTFVKTPCRVKQWKWKTNDLGDGSEGGREEERKEVLDRKVKTETKQCIYSYHYMKTEWYRWLTLTDCSLLGIILSAFRVPVYFWDRYCYYSCFTVEKMIELKQSSQSNVLKIQWVWDLRPGKLNSRVWGLGI